MFLKKERVLKAVRRRAMKALMLPAVLGMAGVLSDQVAASWKPPEVVFSLTSPTKYSRWPIKTFLGRDDEGRFVYLEAVVTVKDGQPEITPSRAPFLSQELSSAGGGLGLLPYSHRTLTEGFLRDYAGRTIRRVEAWGGKVTPLADGSFIVAEHRLPFEAGYSDIVEFRNFRYYLYSADGRYLRELNRPPAECISIRMVDGAGITPDLQLDIQEEKRPAELSYEEKVALRKAGKLWSLTNAHRTSFGFVSNLPDYYAWNEKGELISSYFMNLLEPQKTIATYLRQIDPGEPEKDSPYRTSFFDFVDRDGTIYREGYSPKAYCLFRFEWVNDDGPPLSPPAKITPLDGFGYPLPEKPGPPSFHLEWEPKPGTQNPAPVGGGPTLTFLFPDQDIRVWNGYYPVYSLWDYQLSLFQRDHPGAIRGSISRPLGNDWAAEITVDLRETATCGCVKVHLGGIATYDYLLKSAQNGGGFDYPDDKMRHGCTIRFTDDWRARLKAQGEMVPVAWSDPGWEELNKNLHAFDRNPLFDPTVPDILKPYINATNLETNHPLLIETGDDTKVFVGPTVMTRLWMEPRTWPGPERAKATVYSRNWLTDQDDQVQLLETSPGSRRFEDEDGAVIYEITHILNESPKDVRWKGRDELDALLFKDVPRTGPEEVDLLYLYITDPKLGLKHAPQLLYENGIDTGEYWSFSEPPWLLINYPYGPWPYKPWRQVSEEIAKAPFYVEAGGPNLPAHPALDLSWDGPDGKRQRVIVPMAPSGEGKYKTTVPLLAFGEKGCDIGKSWKWTDKVPTPQIPGVITFRESSPRWALISGSS